MKRNRLLWILMIALVVPLMTIGCDKKHASNSNDDDDDSSNPKSEKVDSDESDSKKEEKKLIFGEYKLEKESVKNFFEQDLLSEAKKAGINIDIFSSFNFNDDDMLKCQVIFKGSYPIGSSNRMTVNILVRGTGTWQHNRADKLLTVNIDNVTLSNDDIDISFTKDDAAAKQALNYVGGKDGLRKMLKIDADMEKFKGTQVFTVTRLQPDGFTIKRQESDKRMKFDKVESDD